MSNSIRLYTQNDCPYCVLMKKKLDSWGYGYTEINVSYDTNARKFLKDNNHRTVPQLYAGNIHLNEGADTAAFNKRHLEIALNMLVENVENDSGVEMFG